MRARGSSANGELFDNPKKVGGGYIVQRVFIFLFKPPAQIFGGNITCFAIAEVPFGARGKLDETRMRQTKHYALAIHEKLAIHGVAVARSDSIPAVREAAAVHVVGHFRRYVECANEIAHGSGIWNGGRFRVSHSRPTSLRRLPLAAPSAGNSESPRPRPHQLERAGLGRARFFLMPRETAGRWSSGRNIP